MTMSIDLKNSAILTLLLFVSVSFNIHQCSRKPMVATNVVTNTTSDTVWQDTGTHVVHIKPVVKYVDKTDTLWKYMNIDTSAILADYNTTKTYDTTINTPNDIECRVISKIKYNELLHTSIYTVNKRETVVNNHYYYKNGWIAGVGINSDIYINFAGGYKLNNNIFLGEISSGKTVGIKYLRTWER